MSTFEIASLIISAITLVALMAGLYYAIRQINVAVQQLADTNKIHQSNHEWNRRNAAQEALRQYNYSLLTSPLQDTFNYLNVTESIPLSVINKHFEAHKGLQGDLHELLNFYEGLARGINQALFDEEVIKAARKNAMIRTERAFENYLIDRRNKISPLAWKDLSSIISHWKNLDDFVPPRTKTG